MVSSDGTRLMNISKVTGKVVGDRLNGIVLKHF